MNVVVSALARQTAPGRSRSPEVHQIQEVVIGKDILELVSSAMYVDAMTIYREYVQNAADSIDAAKIKGVLRPESPAEWTSRSIRASRTVIIRDNGGGVAFPQFARKLTALGGGTKRYTLPEVSAASGASAAWATPRRSFSALGSMARKSVPDAMGLPAPQNRPSRSRRSLRRCRPDPEYRDSRTN